MRLLTELLPYQQAAVDKLIGIKIGALYMEMGTGKTRTALEFVARRYDDGKIDACLWLCPCSVKANLRADLSKHAEGWEDVIAIHGIESLSGSARLAGELMSVAMSKRVMLIVDESSLVKNHTALRSMRVTAIAERCPYRMILNGTPVSKCEADLYSQWYLLDWRVLGYRSFFTFAANHLEYDKNIPGKIVRTLNTDYLARKIAPYTYQVLRKDCFPLPGKYNEEWHYNMTLEQRDYYLNVAEMMLGQVDEGKPDTLYRFFAAMQLVISGMYVIDERHHLKSWPMFARPEDNPRIVELLDRITGEKTLIFAKYTHEINAIRNALDHEYGEGSTVMFYGDIPQRKRQESIEKFRGDARFMVANKACAGFGLNLQFCNRIIFYSNDWDYATRIQAEDRVYRYGQTREVYVADIIAQNTLDERIMRCLSRKEGLLDDVRREIKGAMGTKAKLLDMIGVQ